MELKANWAQEHRRGLMAAFAVIAVLVLIIGLSLSWFVYNKNLSTVGEVQLPATLKVLGPNATSMEQIDLTYTKSEVGEGGKVTLKRAFCVESDGDPFELQIANTTNIEGLDIKLYRVSVNEDSSTSGYIEGIDSQGHSYSWLKSGDDLLPNFTFINKQDGKNLAKKPSGNNDPTFESSANVQENAAPLYRHRTFKKDELDSANDGKVTNFIIELSWVETAKETDMVYTIARNAAVEG